MTRHGAARAWAIALGLSAIAAPTRADPQHVVVTELRGDRGHAVQSAIERMLSDAHVEVETDTTSDAGPRLTGSVIRNRKKHFILTIKIAGEPVSSLDLGKKGQLTKANAATLRRQLLARVRALAAEQPEATQPPPAKEPTATAVEATPPSAPEQPPPAKAPAPPPEAPPPVAPPVAVAPAVTRSPFESFAAVRHALPWNLVALRGYWDSRQIGALEQVTGFRAPLDVSVLSRMTLRSNVGGAPDVTTFHLEAFLWSPMVFSFGAVVVVGGAAGADNDSIRPGIGQTLLLSSGSVSLLSMVAITAYDTVRSGGGATLDLALTVGPLRSELFAIVGWEPGTTPSLLVVRPDLRVRVWKSFGVYGQYEIDTSLAIRHYGLRVGAELSAQF